VACAVTGALGTPENLHEGTRHRTPRRIEDAPEYAVLTGFFKASPAKPVEFTRLSPWCPGPLEQRISMPRAMLVAVRAHPVSSYPMTDFRLAFIGGGNMAGSLIGGLIADGWRPDRIRVADPDNRQTDRLQQRFHIATAPDNRTAVEQADAVVLAVKPQVIRSVAMDLGTAIAAQRPLVISIAAGIDATALRSWLGKDTAIVRAMPNTPALVQSGATALYANPATSEEQRNLAESVLRAVGLTIWIDNEELMDAVTALSGSGPAYFFLFMEALQQAGIRLGLPADTARLLTLQTAFGAAKMALESSDDAATLRRRVTSPGGTTECALAYLQQQGFEASVLGALQAAAQRSRELATEFGRQT